MFDKSLLQIDTNTLIVTATSRLAKMMRYAYDQEQITQDKTTWQPFPVKSWKEWIKQLWSSHHSAPELLLNTHQEHALWLETTEQPYALVEEIQKGWRLVQDELIPLTELKKQASTLETQQFCVWVEKFLSVTEAHHWVPESMLGGKLLQLGKKQVIALPCTIKLVGFEELTPIQKALIELFKKNSQIIQHRGLNLAAHPRLRSFPDFSTELQHMTLWVKQQTEKNRLQSIACISPHLSQYRQQILQTFNRLSSKEAIAFRISGGEPLTNFPLIAIGLEALKLGLGSIDLETIGAILQSPYLCQNPDDVNIGAFLAEELRNAQKSELPLSTFFKPLTAWQNYYPQNTWVQRWRNFLRITQTLRAEALPSEWAEIFHAQLIALGWPGAHSKNHAEFQLLERWREFLEEFTELDPITGKITQLKAYNLFTRLQKKTLFQPKQAEEEHIQVHILDVLETSGLEFGAIWVMGLNEEGWPRPPQINVFLPYTLQKQNREWEYAYKTTQRLQRSAREIVFSYSANASDQTPKPSPLIKEFNSANDNEISCTIWPFWKDEIGKAVEEYDEEYAPPLNLAEKVRGGSKILTLQAECPFKAFATIRLQANPLNKPVLGLSLKEQGKLLHICLEKIWKHLKNQENLAALSETTLSDLCQQITQSVVQGDTIFVAVEQIRLKKILLRWLNLEKSRPPFVVLEQETTRYVNIGDLNLTLQIDRIDQLSNGKLMIIDYKTGKQNLQAWFKPRLEQPQLPLYCIFGNTADATFSALAFAEFRPDYLKFTGIHDENLTGADYFPAGIKSADNWRALLEYWRDQLQKLSSEFCRGYAVKDPGGEKTPCRNCSLHSLCRIQEG